MDPGGFEPPTFSMPLRRAPNCAMGPELISFQYQFLRTVIEKTVHWYCSLSCGPEGIRTPDLFSAIEARSQLRYRPEIKVQGILPEAKGDVKHRDKLTVRKSILQIPYIMLSSGVHAHLLKLSYSPPYKKFGDGGSAVAEFQFKERVKACSYRTIHAGSANPTPIHKFSTQFCNPIFTAIF